MSISAVSLRVVCSKLESSPIARFLQARRASTALAGCRQAPVSIARSITEPRRGDTESIPDITRVKLDFVLLEQPDVLVLKSLPLMVLLLRSNVLGDSIFL